MERESCPAGLEKPGSAAIDAPLGAVEMGREGHDLGRAAMPLKLGLRFSACGALFGTSNPFAPPTND